MLIKRVTTGNPIKSRNANNNIYRTNNYEYITHKNNNMEPIYHDGKIVLNEQKFATSLETKKLIDRNILYKSYTSNTLIKNRPYCNPLDSMNIQDIRR